MGRNSMGGSLMPRIKVPRWLPWLACAALSIGASSVSALPDDRSQDIEITAERAIRDERAGYTIYSGDVILEQGSLLIEADRLTIYHDAEAADRIIAVGEPATLRQQPELDKGFVTASAGRIVYEKTRERVLLRQDAVIEQDGAVVSGESIDYFMAEQRVRADAPAADEDARVQVIIPAAVIEEQTEDEPEAPNADAATFPEPEPESTPETAPDVDITNVDTGGQ